MQHEEREHWREATAPRREAGDAEALLDEMLSRPAGTSGRTGGADFLREQVAARPWLAVGAAIVAGFVLGASESDSSDGRRRSRELDDELSLVRGAAIAALAAGAQGALADAAPELEKVLRQSGILSRLGLSQPMGQPSGQQHMSGEIPGNGIGVSGGDFGGRQVSSAQNTSFDTGAGAGAVGYDSAPAPGDTEGLSNYKNRGAEHIGPVYPAGGAADRSMAEEYNPGKAPLPDIQDILRKDPEDHDRR